MVGGEGAVKSQVASARRRPRATTDSTQTSRPSNAVIGAYLSWGPEPLEFMRHHPGARASACLSSPWSSHDDDGKQS